jgi:hypothetical protein
VSEREIHLELLLGRKIFDGQQNSVGRLEEVIAVREGDDLVVSEYHVGTAGLVERLSAGNLPFLGKRRTARGYRIKWDQLDLTDLRRPRILCPVEELARIEPE